jgi:hypothetical protein
MKIKKTTLTDNVRESIKGRQKIVWDSLFYTNQRMDLLIITISGAGIYTCGEVSKYFIEKKLPISNELKIAASLFVFSIIVNFISQWFASVTHNSDYCSIIYQLDDEIDESIPLEERELFLKKRKEQIDHYENRSDSFNKWTLRCNTTSIVLMFLGLILLLYYLSSTF